MATTGSLRDQEGSLGLADVVVSGTKFCSKPETSFNLEQSLRLLNVVRCSISSLR